MYNGAGIYKNGGMDEAQVRELMLNTIGGRTYKTTKIGNQIWLAENLDYKFLGLDVGNTVYDATIPQANYYDNDESTYGAKGLKYGLLYNFAAAKYLIDNQEAIIPGWRLPTMDEWDALLAFAGGNTETGRKAIKATEGWPSYADGPGTNTTGFSAAPSGRLTYDGVFNSKGTMFTMFTQTWSTKPYSIYAVLVTVNNVPLDTDSNDSIRQYSIRLVRDA